MNINRPAVPITVKIFNKRTVQMAIILDIIKAHKFTHQKYIYGLDRILLYIYYF